VNLRDSPEAQELAYEETLRLAGSLRLCDRRVQSTSWRTSSAEQRTRQSLAGSAARQVTLEGMRERARLDEVCPSNEVAPRVVPLHRHADTCSPIARPAKGIRLSLGEDRPDSLTVDDVGRLGFALARPLSERRTPGVRTHHSDPPAVASSRSCEPAPRPTDAPIYAGFFAAAAKCTACAKATRRMRAVPKRSRALETRILIATPLRTRLRLLRRLPLERRAMSAAAANDDERD
jgi:hypothetical protein